MNLTAVSGPRGRWRRHPDGDDGAAGDVRRKADYDALKRRSDTSRPDHGTQTLVPSQHPRSRHRLRLAGHCVLLAAPDHPFSDLRVDPQNWLGSTVVSGEGQVLQGRLVQAPVEAVTAVGVVSGAGHVIELADAGHHSARVLLLHRLSSRGHQRLD